MFTALRASADYVIVDTPPGFTPEVIAAIDLSTNVCIVGVLDSLSLKNTKLGLETLELMGYDPGRIALVLNRADTRVGITHEDVEAIIGRSPQVFVPSDRLIPVSVNDGVPNDFIGMCPFTALGHDFTTSAGPRPARGTSGRDPA